MVLIFYAVKRIIYNISKTMQFGLGFVIIYYIFYVSILVQRDDLKFIKLPI